MLSQLSWLGIKKPYVHPKTRSSQVQEEDVMSMGTVAKWGRGPHSGTAWGWKRGGGARGRGARRWWSWARKWGWFSRGRRNVSGYGNIEKWKWKFNYLLSYFITTNFNIQCPRFNYHMMTNSFSPPTHQNSALGRWS